MGGNPLKFGKLPPKDEFYVVTGNREDEFFVGATYADSFPRKLVERLRAPQPPRSDPLEGETASSPRLTERGQIKGGSIFSVHTSPPNAVFQGSMFFCPVCFPPDASQLLSPRQFSGFYAVVPKPLGLTGRTRDFFRLDIDDRSPIRASHVSFCFVVPVFGRF